MKDLSRVGERRFQCAFKACYCLYEVSAIQITHHNDTNLPPEDCLSEEDDSITFVVIVLSLPACVSRLPQRQPLQDMVTAHKIPGTCSALVPPPQDVETFP